MSNMTYCRFQNTYSDLRDCNQAIADMLEAEEGSELREEEIQYAAKLLLLCEEMVQRLTEHMGSGDELPDERTLRAVIKELSDDAGEVTQFEEEDDE